MTYDVVVLDMDGTLVDTDLMLVESMMVLFRKYRPNFKISLSELIYFSGPPIEDTIATFFPNLDTRTIVEEFKELSLLYYERDMMLYPYAKEAIEQLHDLGIPIAILTNKHRDRTIATLKMVGVDHLVDFIVGYDDVKYPKPHPEGMNRIIAHFKANPTQILFVGDTIYDYQVAKSSGVHSALTAWSLRKFPQEVIPNIWLEDFRDLVKVVQHGTANI